MNLYDKRPILPVCDISYTRSAFQFFLDNEQIRLNFDKNVSVSDTSSKDRFQTISGIDCIVEVKTWTPKVPTFLLDLLNNHGGKCEKISKYVLSVNQLHKADNYE